MRFQLSALALILGTFAANPHSGLAQQTATSILQEDASYVDADGTAHVKRIVPMPATVSPEA